jgi:hypothetical protein
VKFEHRHEPLLPRNEFLKRQLYYAAVALAIVAGSLIAGACGYRFLEGLGWLDAFMNAAMLLGGMGPVAVLQHNGAKLFATIYALYSGIVFLVVAGLLFAPVFHRFIHRFHLELDDEGEPEA